MGFGQLMDSDSPVSESTWMGHELHATARHMQKPSRVSVRTWCVCWIMSRLIMTAVSRQQMVSSARQKPGQLLTQQQPSQHDWRPTHEYRDKSPPKIVLRCEYATQHEQKTARNQKFLSAEQASQAVYAQTVSR